MKKHRPAGIVILSALALGISLALIVWFIYILGLRTAYREDALEINSVLLGAAEGTDNIKIGSDDAEFPVTLREAEYYNRFLLDTHTAVYSRKRIEENGKTIYLTFGKGRLSFTKAAQDGTAVAIGWKTAGKDRSYLVRSQTTWMQLEAYFKNLRARQQ